MNYLNVKSSGNANGQWPYLVFLIDVLFNFANSRLASEVNLQNTYVPTHSSYNMI